MKNQFLITAVFLGFQTFVSAQIDKNVGDFSSIKTSNRIKVELIQSTENKVVVKESQQDAVNITNKNGRLILKNTLKELVSEDEYSVTIQVYFKEVKEIDVQGGSYVYSEQPLVQNHLKASANLGSTLRLPLQVETLNVSGNTGAKITLSGSAQESAQLKASAGAQITANELKTARNKIVVNSGSTAWVTATNYLDAQVIAGGKITISGKPKEVKEKVTIGGTIEYVN